MNSLLLQPKKLLLTIGFSVGITLSILTPFATAFDEGTHLARIYDISGFKLMPNTSIYKKSTVSFLEFYTLSQRRFYFRDQSFKLFEPEYFLVRADYENMAIAENSSIYPPLMFFPHAIIAGIGWRILDLPIIPVSIIIRLVGLIIYLSICYLAIRVIPTGKWGLLVIALSPTALYQASTVNGDGYNIAVSFLFISLFLFFIYNPDQVISTRQLLYLCTTIFLLGMSKQGAIILFLLLIFLPRKKFSSRSQLIILWSTVVIMTMFHFLWVITVFDHTVAGQESLAISMRSIFGQFRDYLLVFGRSLSVYYNQLFGTMIAGYGYWTGDVPKLVFFIVPLTFFASLTLDEKNNKITLKTRCIVFVIMIISWMAILFLYTSGKFQGKDQNTFELIQGRYLIPYLPLLLISLIGLYHVRHRLEPLFRWSVVVGVVLGLSFFFWGLYAHYYTPCGPYVLSRSICKLPAYQNIEIVQPPQILIHQQTITEQHFFNSCSNVQSVEILVTEVSADADGFIIFSLASETGRVIASDNYDVRKMNGHQFLTLELSNNPPIQKGDYLISIDATELTGTIGLAVRDVDVYPGYLKMDNALINNDLVFFYNCAPAGFLKY